MKDILKNKKNLMIIGGIAVVAIIIVVLLVCFVFKGDKEKEMSPETLENKLEKMGAKFYEENYYPGVKAEGKVESLASFKDNGIKVNITNLELLVTIDQDVKNKLEKDKCNSDETKIIFYPKNPYGVEDYTMEVELSCEK